MKSTFDPINTIRVIAVLMVYFLHSLLFMGKDFPMSQILEQYPITFLLFTPAWAGCWIFFLISGYLAGVNFVNGKYALNRDGICKYYKRKIGKVYIPTILFIGFAVVMVEPSFFSYENVWLKLITCTYYGEPGFYGVGATWFVFTLMWLYLLAPYGAMLLTDKSNRGLMFAGGGLLFIGLMIRAYGYSNQLNWVIYTYTAPFANIDVFFSGMIYAYWRKNVHTKVKKIYVIPVIMIFLVLLPLNCNMIAYKKYIEVYQYIFPTIYILLSITYLWCVTKEIFVKELYIFKCINWFSSISFEFYLFHSLIMGKLASHIGGHTPIQQYCKYIIIITIVTIIFSIGYHRIIYWKNKGV